MDGIETRIHNPTLQPIRFQYGRVSTDDVRGRYLEDKLVDSRSSLKAGAGMGGKRFGRKGPAERRKELLREVVNKADSKSGW
jgi:hypothetical protein